jgi:hypothetical protein
MMMEKKGDTKDQDQDQIIRSLTKAIRSQGDTLIQDIQARVTPPNEENTKKRSNLRRKQKKKNLTLRLDKKDFSKNK